MPIRVRLFAVAKDLAGSDEVVLELPEGATVGELRQTLADAVPALGPLLPSLLLAVDSEYAPDGLIIRSGSEVAVIPPVSGG